MPRESEPMRVMLLDDSPLVRAALRKFLSRHQDIRVVAEAGDPMEAMRQLKDTVADVLILDMELPRMDGLTFLQKLMHGHPMPVVVVSGLTHKSAKLALACLEAGALEVVPKPHEGYPNERFQEDLLKVLRSTPRGYRPSRNGKPAKAARALLPMGPGQSRDASRIVGIGASTGGPEALRMILAELPADSPGILVVQHMPPGFTEMLVQRLDRVCDVEVCVAQEGMEVIPGRVAFAPCNQQMEVRKGAGGPARVRLQPAHPDLLHNPSVHCLFSSQSLLPAGSSLGVMLTGMGDDGADAMLSMRKASQDTIAQDERSSTVFGMPRSAIERGAAAAVLPLHDIARHIHQFGLTSSRRAS